MLFYGKSKKSKREKGVIMKNKAMQKAVALSMSTLLMATALVGCGEQAAQSKGDSAGTG